ncbi:MAG: DNA polymerase III subunit delta [Candidatus Melainabacteria bacterium GWF2_37_15]|nr:MAG: DNA polymerase III subunit delta [Candidatus Melainabacteria bacterium GWF2_37_15]
MPTYLYWGEEEFNLDNAVRELRKKVLDENFAALNHKTLNEPDINRLIETVQTLPMMLGNLLVEVRATTLFLRGKRSVDSDDPAMKKLIDVVEKLNPRVHLLFICEIERDSGKKVDSTIKLTKTLQKIGEVREFPAFKFYEEEKVVGWITKQCAEKSLKINKDAASLLVQNIGSDLRKIDTELEKIKTALHPKTTVTINEVKEIFATSENVFLFAQCLAEKNNQKAIMELHKLLEQNHPLKILATLHTTTRNWLKIKLNLPVSMAPYRAQKEKEKLKNITPEFLFELKENIKATEFKIKSGQLPPETAMELLCLAAR